MDLPDLGLRKGDVVILVDELTARDGSPGYAVEAFNPNSAGRSRSGVATLAIPRLCRSPSLYQKETGQELRSLGTAVGAADGPLPIAEFGFKEQAESPLTEEESVKLALLRTPIQHAVEEGDRGEVVHDFDIAAFLVKRHREHAAQQTVETLTQVSRALILK